MSHSIGFGLKLRYIVGMFIVGVPFVISAAPVTFSAEGADAAAIQSQVDAFRSALGDPNNGNAPGPIASGRREINWDGGGSNATSPGPNPFTVFHVSRGAFITSPTPGATFVQVPNADLDTFFSNPTYGEANFRNFSPLRLFSPVDSNITDITFFLPGSPATRASVSGFGAVFSDVDIAGGTTLEFFNLQGNPLGSAFSAGTFDNGLSFIGVQFNAGEAVGRVRITTGNVAPGPNDGPGSDVVMMDDFFYAEPNAVPEPHTLLLVGMGFAAMCVARTGRGSK